MGRIIIVDDETVHADLLRLNLADLGHKDIEVFTRPMTQKKVAERAKAFCPDLVIIDDLLDGWKMRGLKIFAILRAKLPKDVEYALVSITAGIPFTRRQYLEAGMKPDHIVAKPFKNVREDVRLLSRIARQRGSAQSKSRERPSTPNLPLEGG